MRPNACRVPDGENIEISGTHGGLVYNRAALPHLAEFLARALRRIWAGSVPDSGTNPAQNRVWRESRPDQRAMLPKSSSAMAVTPACFVDVSRPLAPPWYDPDVGATSV